MIITEKRIVIIAVLAAFLMLVLNVSIHTYKKSKQADRFALNRSFQTQERVTEKYIPRKLEGKGADELTRMGEALWGE